VEGCCWVSFISWSYALHVITFSFSHYDVALHFTVGTWCDSDYWCL
jgi:hypothetical protein